VATKTLAARLDALDARLDRIETDVALIKEHLVTRMRSEGRGGEAAHPRLDHDILFQAGIRLGLTRAESEVAAMLAAGMRVEDIASTRGRDKGTIFTLMSRAYRRLGVPRQLDLVRLVLLEVAQGRQ